jgi:hypothetical protein
MREGSTEKGAVLKGASNISIEAAASNQIKQASSKLGQSTGPRDFVADSEVGRKLAELKRTRCAKNKNSLLGTWTIPTTMMVSNMDTSQRTLRESHVRNLVVSNTFLVQFQFILVINPEYHVEHGRLCNYRQIAVKILG